MIGKKSLEENKFAYVKNFSYVYSMKQKDKSRLLSLVLRHKPETIGITLDENGWTDVKILINKIGSGFTFEELVEVVETNDKKRFAFNDNKTKIRASQGHSLGIDLKLLQTIPPEFLYHGTATKNIQNIYKEGIKKGKRDHVHLSHLISTADKVGSRHGTPSIIKIDTERMWKDGIKFYVSDNGVWLTDYVDPKYFNKTLTYWDLQD